MRSLRVFPALLAAILGATTLGASLSAPSAAAPASRPDAAPSLTTVAPPLVINRDFPDPDVSHFGSTYYAYSTNSGKNLPVATAPAPGGPWTVSGSDGLPNLGAWASGGRTWAPDVSQRPDGKYLLYYAAHSVAANTQCIGAATASSPAGPFTPVGAGALVCNAGEGGEIDPSSFVDTDGSRYLLYKNDGNSIGRAPSLWLQRVADDGVTFVGARHELLRNDRADEGGVIEAPVLVHRPSRYVLFYSQGNYGGDAYATSYATSATLTGAYTKAYRPLMTTASFDNSVRGPGGADILGDRIVFHGWINSYSARGMYVADLGWTGDLPVVRGSRVRYEAERGTLNDCAARADAAASQGSVVGKIDYADSWVQIGVFAPTAGNYTIHIGYAAGYGNAQQTLTVNGGNATVVNYPDHGWENWQQVGVGVTLNAGGNTLRFTHLTAYAELDFIEPA
ncbi:MAG: family 43 glycosylhydrolase [Actinocatenispora sp.]